MFFINSFDLLRSSPDKKQAVFTLDISMERIYRVRWKRIASSGSATPSIEKEYFSKKGNQYAQKFVSDEGKQNGLYWVSAGKQSKSPIGPLVGNAGSR
jgi:hypothetical protein